MDYREFIFMALLCHFLFLLWQSICQKPFLCALFASPSSRSGHGSICFCSLIHRRSNSTSSTSRLSLLPQPSSSPRQIMNLICHRCCCEKWRRRKAKGDGGRRKSHSPGLWHLNGIFFIFVRAASLFCSRQQRGAECQWQFILHTINLAFASAFGGCRHSTRSFFHDWMAIWWWWESVFCLLLLNQFLFTLNNMLYCLSFPFCLIESLKVRVLPFTPASVPFLDGICCCSLVESSSRLDIPPWLIETDLN